VGLDRLGTRRRVTGCPLQQLVQHCVLVIVECTQHLTLDVEKYLSISASRVAPAVIRTTV
jgi:hypothetical protein